MDPDSIKARGIPECTNGEFKPVNRGEVLGRAGDTGTPPGWTHLHFEVRDKDGNPLDPYDIEGKKDQYPDPNFTNGKFCGPQTLWRNCPIDPDLDKQRVEATPRATATPVAKVATVEAKSPTLAPARTGTPRPTVTQVEKKRANFDKEFSEMVFNSINHRWRERLGFESFRHSGKLSKIVEKLALDFIDLEDFEDVFKSGRVNYKSLADEVGYDGNVKGEVYVTNSIHRPDEEDSRDIAEGFSESEFLEVVFRNSLYEDLSVACLGRKTDRVSQRLCIFVAGAPHELKIDGELKPGYFRSPEEAIRSEFKVGTKDLSFDEKCEIFYCGHWIQTRANKRLYSIGALPDFLERIAVEKTRDGWHIIDSAFRGWPGGFEEPIDEIYVGFEDRSRDVIFGIISIEKLGKYGGYTIRMYFENLSGRSISWASDIGNKQIYVEVIAIGYEFASMDAGGRYGQDFPDGMPSGTKWYGWHYFPVFGSGILILHYPGRLPIEINLETGQVK